MNPANPTPITVGLSGTFNGRRYRVAGRMVLGMEEGGELYCWNEFNLVGPEGQGATLVYEEGERGGEWRMFTLFEPDCPMTAADAASRRVGDQLNLEGTDLRVTLVDESRVYFIEGEAPEGVEVGDVAHYFNAEAGRNMVVVSWTGDEVEYYRGLNLTAGLVASAFNLPREQLESLSLMGSGLAGDAGSQARRGVWIALVVLAAFIGFAGYTSCRPFHSRAAIVRQAAPAAPLKLPAAGTLAGHAWRVTSHAVVEIAEVGRVFDRHEYQLRDAETNRALLVCGLQPGDSNWTLFTPLTPLQPLRADEAAALRVGDLVSVDGLSAPVTELFRSLVREADGGELSELTLDAVRFGLLARTNTTILLLRWNAGQISFQRGRTFSARDGLAAFRDGAGR